jgi:steroid 5-alpha reductase family enzyme
LFDEQQQESGKGAAEFQATGRLQLSCWLIERHPFFFGANDGCWAFYTLTAHQRL